jgi:hypothetical protein
VRSSVPLGHKLIAVVISVATACGLYAFLRYREAQQALTASLSFDSAAAQQLDPGITRVPHPAVVLGQSILSDSVVARLVPQADLAASSAADAVGEFRARLELTQPTAGLLRVRYRDPIPGQAAATANAVAKALAGWVPSIATTTALPPSASVQFAPLPAPAPAPAPGATEQHPPAARSSLAAAMGQLHAQLSAADQRVGSKSSFRSEHDRQRYLESQVGAAQQKLNDLRIKFAQSGSASDAQARLDAVRHALALFWPSAARLNTAGTSEKQLAYEREQLARIMGVIEQQNEAALHAETAQPGESANPASANPPSQPPAPLPPQPQPNVAAAVSSPPASGANQNPLRLAHIAGLPAPVAWWPSVLIGCFCGLIYWGLAFARHRSSRESDDQDDQLNTPEESSNSIYRLSDADAPVEVDSREEWIEAYRAETSSHKRASFSFDPDSTSAPDPRPSPPPEPVQASTENTAPDDLPKTVEARAETGSAEAASDGFAGASMHGPGELDEVSQQQIAGSANSWEEEIRKNLSHTSLARSLDPQSTAEDVNAAKGPARDVGPSPSEPDRLTG